MSFSSFTHPEAEDDLKFLLEYFIDEASLEVSLNFLDAIEETTIRIIEELDKGINRAPKFEDVFGIPIKANPNRKNYAKNFKDYHVWYTIETAESRIIIWAIESTRRDPDLIKRMLKGRRE